MFDQTICADTHSATSSLGLEFGPTLFVDRAGKIRDQYGWEVARASLSARQVKELDLLTSGTYGRLSITSSPSADLQSFLESRLRAKTQILGSTLYKMTWKPWVTPLGRSRFRLRASVLRTSETGSTGWPTPTASLADKGVRSTEGGIREAMRSRGPDLAAVSCLTVNGPARLTATGELLTGSDAQMESGGQLNPAHPRWLMGVAGRVGRLRAYGNAINAEAATEFIRAYKEIA